MNLLRSKGYGGILAFGFGFGLGLGLDMHSASRISLDGPSAKRAAIFHSYDRAIQLGRIAGRATIEVLLPILPSAATSKKAERHLLSHVRECVYPDCVPIQYSSSKG